MSPSTATAEADACLSCIKGKKFELPVYYDMEYQPAMSTSNSNYTKMAVNFCNKLKSNGFKSGVYSSASVYDYLLNRTTLKNNGGFCVFVVCFKHIVFLAFFFTVACTDNHIVITG